MQLLRSLQFVPGNRRDMLEKACALDADVLIADLEDSVPPEQKAAARELVSEMGPGIAANVRKLAVRVNSLDTGLTSDELDAIVGNHLYGVSIGKVETPYDVQECDRLLTQSESLRGLPIGGIKIIPWIESAMAVLKAVEIATASERIVALAFGAEDYTHDMRINRTDKGDEVYMPRAILPIAARAAGVVALDSPYAKFSDLPGLQRDASSANTLGYKGKFSIHPKQLDIINTTFSPTQDEITYAHRVIEAWELGSQDGKGAVNLDGAMVDVPVVKRARNILSYAAQISKAQQDYLCHNEGDRN